MAQEGLLEAFYELFSGFCACGDRRVISDRKGKKRLISPHSIPSAALQSDLIITTRTDTGRSAERSHQEKRFAIPFTPNERKFLPKKRSKSFWWCRGLFQKAPCKKSKAVEYLRRSQLSLFGTSCLSSSFISFGRGENKTTVSPVIGCGNDV